MNYCKNRHRGAPLIDLAEAAEGDFSEQFVVFLLLRRHMIEGFVSDRAFAIGRREVTALFAAVDDLEIEVVRGIDRIEYKRTPSRILVAGLFLGVH